VQYRDLKKQYGVHNTVKILYFVHTLRTIEYNAWHEKIDIDRQIQCRHNQRFAWQWQWISFARV